MEGCSMVTDYNKVRFAMTNLLCACRDGVDALARMDAIGKVVSMTEGRS